jgi:hypothetical protein
MIIEQPLKSNDTVTIKITGGDEIVARYVQEDDKTITVSKPLALIATANGLGLGPFAFTISPDAKLKINKNTVVFITRTEESMASQYMTSTSPIKTASSIPGFMV